MAKARKRLLYRDNTSDNGNHQGAEGDEVIAPASPYKECKQTR